MSELMAESAHAVDTRAGILGTLQFIEHRELIDGHTVEEERTRHAATPGIGLGHIPLAWPDALGNIAPCLGLAHTGIEHHDHIDIAVTIVVIIREIHLIYDAHAGIIDHRTQLDIQVGPVAHDVTAVIGAGLRQVNRAQDVELRRETSAGLRLEIMEAAVILGIELVLERRHWILVDESHIGIVHQDDGDARRAQRGHLGIEVLVAARRPAYLSTQRHLVAIGCDESRLGHSTVTLVMGQHIAQ